MADVLKWSGITRHNIPVSDVIKEAKKQKLVDCLVIGWDKDGELYFASSTPDGPEALWLLELSKKRLIEMGDPQ